MTNLIHALPAKWLTATALSAALILTACGSPRHASPEKVAASNPTVTYKYRNDQELIEANQRSVSFCSQYQATPRADHFGSDADGSKVVYFECVAMLAPATPTPPYAPNLKVTYRADQELLNASRDAQLYCLNNGSQQMFSNIVVNGNGTRTVTFQCGQL